MKTEKSQSSRAMDAADHETFEAAFQRAHLRVDVAKQRMRLAKEELKRARKRYKEAKRMSKRARKEAAAARKAWKRAEPKAVKQADKKAAAKEVGTSSVVKPRAKLKAAATKRAASPAKRGRVLVH